MEVSQAEVVLCEFYFSDLEQNKLRPVVVLKNNLPFDDGVSNPPDSLAELSNLPLLPSAGVSPRRLSTNVATANCQPIRCSLR